MCLMTLTTIGLGTWNMESAPKASVDALRKGIEAGANHIDTAEMYGDGKVEEIVAEAVSGIRKNIFIISKVLPSNATYAGTIEACERSLRRLKTDYLDGYLLHWRQKNTRIEEAFKAFEKLKEQGKIRQWGVSNFSASDMEESIKIMGKGKIIWNQVLYHPEERAIEFDLIPWCKQNGVTVVAYSPFGQGKIAKHPDLSKIANGHGAAPAQIILSYLTRDPAVIAIPKSSDAKRTQENVQAMRIKLSKEEIEVLDRAFPARRRSSLPTL